MIQELEFTGKITWQKCPICKLRVKKDDEVLGCPQCKSVFHKDHLLSWLKEIPHCPVCQQDFSALVKKYRSLIYAHGQAPSLVSIQVPEEFIITNEHPMETNLFLRILLTILGLVFALGPTIGISFSLDFPQSLYLNWLALFTSLVGMSIIYFGFKYTKMDITNTWTSMLLTKDDITFTSELSPRLRLSEAEISSIVLDPPFYLPKDNYQKKSHTISLKIITSKNKAYHFDDIYTSNNEASLSIFHRTLQSKLRQFSGVTINTDSKKFVRHLKANWKFYLVAIILHFAFSAICIVIEHYVV